MRGSVAAWSVALSLLASACAPRGALDDGGVASGTGIPAQFIALGTEPFWAAEVDGTALLYTTPEDQQGQRVALTRRDMGGRTEFSGTLVGDALALRIDAGPCSDGMSDTVYPFSAELRIGSQSLNGCAKPR